MRLGQKVAHAFILLFEKQSLLSIVLIVGLSRLVALSLLPNSPSSFGPDEGTYASLALWVSEGKSVQGFPSYGPELYNVSKTFILPAAGIITLGADSLLAVRIVSLMFGIVSIYYFGKLMLLILNASSIRDLQSRKLKRILVVSLLIFGFLPSQYLWSILGLRESASTLFVLLTLYLLVRLRFSLFTPKDLITKIQPGTQLLAVMLAFTFAFGSRPQTALVFCVFFCTVLIALSSRKRTLLTVAFLFSVMSGHLFTYTPETKLESVASNVFRESLGQTYVKKALILEDKRNVNALDAATALPSTSCLSSDPLPTRIMCNFEELPFRLFSILFRPLLFVDSGSRSNNLAALENLAWVFLVSLSLYSSYYLIKKRLWLFIVVPTFVYAGSFLVLMSLYEGNLGTAFRHKSSVLWSLLLLTFLYFSAKDQTMEVRRFNGPELPQFA